VLRATGEDIDQGKYFAVEVNERKLMTLMQMRMMEMDGGGGIQGRMIPIRY